MGVLGLIRSVLLCNDKALGDRGIDQDGNAVKRQDSNACVIVLLGRGLLKRERGMFLLLARLKNRSGLAIAALRLARNGLAVSDEGRDEIEQVTDFRRLNCA